MCGAEWFNPHGTHKSINRPKKYCSKTCSEVARTGYPSPKIVTRPVGAWGDENDDGETAVISLTDVHYGKRTATYNPEVCAARFQALTERLRKIAALLQKAHKIDGLVVLLMGDANDGTDIYASQPHHQAITNVEQQAQELAKILEGFLKEQVAIWGRVRVACVAGNHGRTSKSAHEGASWDVVCYRYLKLAVEPEIPVSIEQDPFLQVLNVRGHGVLLYHGHAIKMYQTIPYYGISQRVLRWRSATASVPAFDVAVMGHFHTLGHAVVNGVQILMGGTMISDDPWALQTLGMESTCKWWLWGVSKKHAITWQYALDLV